MALRRRGKNGYYHAYFRTVVMQADGSLRYAFTTVNLFTDDLIAARALEAELMAKSRAARLHQRATAKLRQLEVAAGVRPPEEAPGKIARKKRVRRLRIADALEAAAKYKPIGETTAKRFRAFVKSCKLRYMDEVTPQVAFDYLCKKAPEDRSGRGGSTGWNPAGQ